MAAATMLYNEPARQISAGIGFKKQRVTLAFPTTDATCTIAVKGFTVVTGVTITWAAAPASDEVPYWADTLRSDGTFLVPSTGIITIGRTAASKTSALKATVDIEGY